MVFHVAPSRSQVLDNLLSRGAERITQRHVHVLVLVGGLRRAVGESFAPGLSQVHADREQVPLAVVSVRCLDGHAATDERVGEPLEFGDALADAGFHGLGGTHVTELDIQRYLHPQILDVEGGSRASSILSSSHASLPRLPDSSDARQSVAVTRASPVSPPPESMPSSAPDAS